MKAWETVEVLQNYLEFPAHVATQDEFFASILPDDQEANNSILEKSVFSLSF